MRSGLLAGTVAGAPLWLWIAFHALVLCLLIADFSLTRDAVPRKTVERRSFWLTGCWVAAALLFALVVGRALSPADGVAYLTGYGIEEALSIDNLFVFVVLFRLFRLDSADQRRVLFYGVLGAIVLRGAMIFAGIALLDNVRWMKFLFGAVLLLTAWHLLRESRRESEEQPPRAIRWLVRHLSGGSEKRGDSGGAALLRLLPAILAIEATDALFATDSVPAVLAVTHHPFVAYASNILAVLGLRSLYFTVAAALARLSRLHYGLAAILIFIGGKMMLAKIWEPPVWVSLAVVASCLTVSAAWSLLQPAPLENQ